MSLLERKPRSTKAAAEKDQARVSERDSRPVQNTESGERKSTRMRERPSRVALKLDVPPQIRAENPGKFFAYINDEKGQVQQRMSRGWEVVKGVGVSGSYLNKDVNATGDVVAVDVGMGHTVNSMKAVLMMIDQELYDDDVRELERSSLAFESSLRRGSNATGETMPGGGTYAPNLDNGARGFSRDVEED